MKKISVVIPTFDEEWDLEATVALAQASDPAPHEIIVVDDCSTRDVRERLCSFPDVIVHRTEKQLGAGPAKRIGGEIATGDTIILLDSHMRMPLDWLQVISDARDLFPNAVMCTVCRNFEATSTFCGSGAEFSRRRDIFLGRRWLPRGAVETIDRCPCLLGACYIIPKHVWDAMSGINPNLRGWGYGEQDLSIRAWLYGYEVRRINGLVIPHRFNRKNPEDPENHRMSTWHNSYNAFVTASTIFEEGVFERLYLPYFKQVLPKKALDTFWENINAINEFREAVQSARVYSDEELHSLCDFRHPTYKEQKLTVDEILSARRVDVLSKRREAVTATETEPDTIPLVHCTRIIQSIPENGKMLEWGVGTSTAWFHAHLKEGQSLVSIEHDKKWYDKMLNEGVPDNAIRLYAMPYRLTAPPSIQAEQLPGEEVICLDVEERYVACEELDELYDVILIDGILRNACLLKAVDLLKPNGIVYLHDAQRSWYMMGKQAYTWTEKIPGAENCPKAEMWVGAPV